ncbi:unnamed protein product [Rangifer tarandus platyrhynchus]|uniref:EF-hand Ca insensitive domain-containing protein n=1 Tax=Rangifer tarandus platyrhynchus TaxID=3082113 RepID=A0ABN9A673_RANTA|nr:unnamed protein product [Rangifer tarandus platyrhynchus]
MRNVDESNRPSEESADSRHVTKHRCIQHSHLAGPQLTAHSSEEIESAFRALSSEGKSYVTKEELYQNLTREQADYCVSHMKPYVDGKGRELPTAFDYVEFTRSLFVN